MCKFNLKCCHPNLVGIESHTKNEYATIDSIYQQNLSKSGIF